MLCGVVCGVEVLIICTSGALVLSFHFNTSGVLFALTVKKKKKLLIALIVDRFYYCLLLLLIALTHPRLSFPPTCDIALLLRIITEAIFTIYNRA